METVQVEVICTVHCETGFPFPAHAKVYYASLDRTPLRVSNHGEVTGRDDRPTIGG